MLLWEGKSNKNILQGYNPKKYITEDKSNKKIIWGNLKKIL
jgi:hypothetical protein